MEIELETKLTNVFYKRAVYISEWRTITNFGSVASKGRVPSVKGESDAVPKGGSVEGEQSINQGPFVREAWEVVSDVDASTAVPPKDTDALCVGVDMPNRVGGGYPRWVMSLRAPQTEEIGVDLLKHRGIARARRCLAGCRPDRRLGIGWHYLRC